VEEDEVKVNDKFRWESQAGGYRKSKVGCVVAVVPADVAPWHCVPEGMHLDGPGMARNHESYLVQVGTSKKLYWPRLSALRQVTP
jgi:hypothetical protein